MSAAFKILLVVSLASNVVLAGLLLFGDEPDGARDSSAGEKSLCAQIPASLDFFIEGLEKGHDAFYTPIAVHALDKLLMHCVPSRADDISSVMPHLRQQLMYMVTANTPPDRKRAAHDEALRIFRELRAWQASGT
jgi:hypothetical protein